MAKISLHIPQSDHTFVIRCLDSIIPAFALSEFRRLLQAFVAEQADLNFTWSQTPKTCFFMTGLM